MKVQIYTDEMYPVWYIDAETDGYGTVVDIPQDLLDRYNEVREQFDTVQNALAVLYDNAIKTEKMKASNSPCAIQSMGF